jgi:hypothetical protein
MKKRHLFIVTALVGVSLLMLVPVAYAGGGGGGTVVNAGGSCGAQSEWSMKLKPDDSNLELEFEVDSNVSGQSWNVRIRQNGARIFSGTRVTQGASGSFLTRRPNDTAGTASVRRSPTPTGACVGRSIDLRLEDPFQEL